MFQVRLASSRGMLLIWNMIFKILKESNKLSSDARKSHRQQQEETEVLFIKRETGQQNLIFMI